MIFPAYKCCFQIPLHFGLLLDKYGVAAGLVLVNVMGTVIYALLFTPGVFGLSVAYALFGGVVSLTLTRPGCVALTPGCVALTPGCVTLTPRCVPLTPGCVALTPGCQIFYMDRTGCHQLNVFTVF
jgi:hypothetical protein